MKGSSWKMILCRDLGALLSRRQAGHQDILLDIPMPLLGSPQSPDQALVRPVEHVPAAWLCRFLWLLPPVHPHGKR